MLQKYEDSVTSVVNMCCSAMMRRYRLTIVGHSLGAGVASLLTLFLICDTKKLGGISSDLISCIAIAPPRVMSLDLALKYSLPITSVIYQVRVLSGSIF